MQTVKPNYINNLNMGKNIWVDVKGYNGVYKMNIKGQVMRDGKILKQFFDRKYICVSLCKNGKWETISIHRLIGIHFKKGRTKHRNCINHINGIKTDNHIDNLEWCSYSENITHAYKNGLRLRRFDDKHWGSKPIIVKNLKNGAISEYNSLSEAARQLNTTQPAISKAIKYNSISRNKLLFSLKQQI